MYKYIFSILLFLSSCSWELLPEAQDIESHSDVHIFEVRNGFDIFYNEKASKSVREYYESGTIVLNGSYFWVSSWWLYYPAGYWEHPSWNCCTLYLSDGTSVSTTTNLDDPNLSHIVSLSESGSIEIFSPSSMKQHTWFYTYWFQTWPLVLSGNIIQSFSDSWHARGPHERTLLGKTQSGKVYFFIFEKPVSLTEVADIIVQDDRFTIDPITLLNLDGWPSTAYYDGENWFRENAQLPIIFRIKK